MMLAVWFCIAEVLRGKIILEKNLGKQKKNILKMFAKETFDQMKRSVTQRRNNFPQLN